MAKEHIQQIDKMNLIGIKLEITTKRQHLTRFIEFDYSARSIYNMIFFLIDYHARLDICISFINLFRTFHGMYYKVLT